MEEATSPLADIAAFEDAVGGVMRACLDAHPKAQAITRTTVQSLRILADGTIETRAVQVGAPQRMAAQNPAPT